MVLDNIEAVKEEEKVKPDERVSRNSIPFRQESFATASKKARLIAKRDAAAEIVSEAISQDVERGRSEKRVLDKHFDYAAKIIALDDEISMLEKPEGTDGKTELIGNRAIRLISKMYKEAKAKSEAVYSDVEQKEEPKTEVITTPVEEVAVAEETPAPVVDVEKIANENTTVVNQNIQEAINNEEKVIADSDIKDIVNESLGIVPPVVEQKQEVPAEMPVPVVVPQTEVSTEIPFVQVAVPQPEVSTEIPVPVTEPQEEVPVEEIPYEEIIDTEAIENIVNEKLHNFLNPVAQENYEYIPMTDDEIAASQEKLQLDIHDAINSQLERKSQEVEETNASKGFSLDGLFVNNDDKDEPLRDEVVVTPEREEPKEEEIEEYTVVDRSIIMTPTEKAKTREVLEKLRAARKKKEELEQESNNIDTDLENEKTKNMEVTAKEDEAKKALEESTMAASKAEQDFAKAISAMEEELEALNSETDAISNGIKVKREQLANLQEDTANRHKEIETLDKENQSKQEEIAKYEELRAMLSGDSEDSIGQRVK